MKCRLYCMYVNDETVYFSLYRLFLNTTFEWNTCTVCAHVKPSRAWTPPSKSCTNWTSFPVPILTRIWADCQVLETGTVAVALIIEPRRVLEFPGLTHISCWPEGSSSVLYILLPSPVWLWQSRLMDLLAGLLFLAAFPNNWHHDY